MRICNLTAIAVFALFAAMPASGANLAEYRNAVDSARRLTIEMSTDLRKGIREGAVVTFDAGRVVQIRRTLPVVYRVESGDGPVEVSNHWLHTFLDQYVVSEDPAKQANILSGIEERLSSISSKIAELESAPRSSVSKDEAKQKLAEILKREEFRKPAEEEQSRFGRWLTEFLEWLEGLLPRPSGEPASKTGLPGLAYWLQIVIIVVTVLLIGFAVFRFAPMLFPALKRRRTDEKAERIVLGEKVAIDKSAEQLFAEAERMARDGDLRGAIRKGYIALLCELDDRKLIGLAPHKTNRDYLRDLRKRGEIYQSVTGLTDVFESRWYGPMPSDESAWASFRARYKEALGRK